MVCTHAYPFIYIFCDQTSRRLVQTVHRLCSRVVSYDKRDRGVQYSIVQCSNSQCSKVSLAVASQSEYPSSQLSQKLSSTVLGAWSEKFTWAKLKLFVFHGSFGTSLANIPTKGTHSSNSHLFATSHRPMVEADDVVPDRQPHHRVEAVMRAVFISAHMKVPPLHVDWDMSIEYICTRIEHQY